MPNSSNKKVKLTRVIQVLERMGSMKYLAKCRSLLEGSKKYSKRKPSGCSTAEIRTLEEHIGFQLPNAYIEYLEWMGKDFDGIFKGSDWFLRDVAQNNEFLPELLEENRVSFKLDKNYLCFFFHQGYMAAWFNLPMQSEDPQIWFFKESKETREPVQEGTFSEFLYKDMQGLLN